MWINKYQLGCASEEKICAVQIWMWDRKTSLIQSIIILFDRAPDLESPDWEAIGRGKVNLIPLKNRTSKSPLMDLLKSGVWRRLRAYGKRSAFSFRKYSYDSSISCWSRTNESPEHENNGTKTKSWEGWILSISDAIYIWEYLVFSAIYGMFDQSIGIKNQN
jgi:hypothetical protein